MRDAIWRWRIWTKSKADKIQTFNAIATLWVTGTSFAMLALWWLANEVANQRCVQGAESNSELIVCYQERSDMYNALLYCLAAVGVPMALVLAVYLLTTLVVGEYSSPRYWRRISWWMTLNCVICVVGAVVQVTAWIVILAR